MSRTFNTDPPLIRGYRDEARPVDADWRSRWEYRNSPRWGTPEYEAWWRARPEPRRTHRNWRRSWDNHTSSAEWRTIRQREYRATVRDLIKAGRYDEIGPPRSTEGWYDWKW